MASAALADRDRVDNITLSRFTGEYNVLRNHVLTNGQIRFESARRFKGQQAPALILTDVDAETGNHERP